jgi:ATP-dependent 26S proteasome regulatory subunit
MFSQLLVGTPMSVGSLEEIIDDNHAIVSTSVGSEHYVSILSFVDKDQLEPGVFEIYLKIIFSINKYTDSREQCCPTLSSKIS